MEEPVMPLDGYPIIQHSLTPLLPWIECSANFYSSKYRTFKALIVLSYFSDFNPGGSWILASAIDSGNTILRWPFSVHWKTTPTAVSLGSMP